MASKWITVREAALLLDVTPSDVRYHARQGTLVAQRSPEPQPGRRPWLISKSSVLRLKSEREGFARRLSKARELVAAGDMSLATIANLTGLHYATAWLMRREIESNREMIR